MTDPLLLIISGLPATGKTTLARRLADHFSLPAMYKDTIKETLCDVTGSSSLVASRKLGQASILLLYQFAEALLQARQPCLIESFFYPELARQDLLNLQAHCPFVPLEIHCHTNISTIFERYEKRFLAGARHPCHLDSRHIQAFKESMPFRPELALPLTLSNQVIELDTTDFAAIDYAALCAQIQPYLNS